MKSKVQMVPGEDNRGQQMVTVDENRMHNRVLVKGLCENAEN